LPSGEVSHQKNHRAILSKLHLHLLNSFIVTC
jgi:hypothetical protein